MAQRKEAKVISLRCTKLAFFIAMCCSFLDGAASAQCHFASHLEVGLKPDLFRDAPTFQSGDTLPKEGVFAVALQPMTDVVYFLRPAGGPAVGYGGLVTFEGLAAGRYEIVASQSVRLDVVGQRPFLPVPVTQRAVECACFEIYVEGGPLTLQLSGVSTPSVSIAVTRLSDH